MAKINPKRWQVFLANRVSKIHSIVATENCNHGKENLSDYAPRGLRLAERLSHDLWWNGPLWLRNNVIPVYVTIPVKEEELQPEVCKTLSFLIAEALKEFEVISKISFYSKVVLFQGA